MKKLITILLSAMLAIAGFSGLMAQDKGAEDHGKEHGKMKKAEKKAKKADKKVKKADKAEGK